ncbi:MAG TPA: T9SS type A sorting domain-containing protein, partial [Saprospiraceae bacterium]|nr:T9SS type A sorting domain-containing protein [Saprospiraceae bacterium]
NPNPMRKPGGTILILSLFMMQMAEAQQLNPFVISSSGGFSATSIGQLSFTVGELSAVETYATASNILTQGFQQPWDFGTYIDEHPLADFAFGVYPNPTDGNFYVLTKSDLPLTYLLSVQNMLGQTILADQFDQQSPTTVWPVDIRNAPQGSYIVTLIIRDEHHKTSYRHIQKITLVP